MPPIICQSILSSPPHLNPTIHDCFIWKTQLNGCYTANTEYKRLLNQNTVNIGNINTSWNWIWHEFILEKIKIMIWSVCHNSLRTAEVLHHRGVLNSPIFQRCRPPIEDTIHLLRDCPLSLQLWRSLNLQDVHFFTNPSATKWLKHGTTGRLYDLFLEGIWWAWRARNAMCIANEAIPLFKLKMEVHNMARIIANTSNQKEKEPDIR